MYKLFDDENRIGRPETGEDSHEKYILFSVSMGDEEKADRSLDELEDLLKTAGGVSLGKVIQNLNVPDRATYIGSGKVQELKDLMEIREADAVLCDDELTPVQHRNLAELLDAKVVDRTMLILDIFAGRATTREGKIQVEMAQLKYRMSRLTGKGTSLSRLGGGIGTRGPGETKLETDRRAIQRRIDSLSREIKTLERVRATSRKKRMESQTPIVAIVGYTNAGKSTLLNKLTSAEILAEDKLFATLDPTTRVCRLPGGQEILLTDTVGFINKLPHQLIDAFKSTLEEARYAGIILHMVDASSPDVEMHLSVVYDTLKSLGIKDKPIITAFNKMDLVQGEGFFLRDETADKVVEISVKKEEGLDELLSAIEKTIRDSRCYIEELIPYNDTSRISRIRKYGQIISEDYQERGVMIKAYIPPSLMR